MAVSATTGRGMKRLMAEALWLADRSAQWIPTPELNRFVGDLQAIREPPAVGGKRLRIYYMSQYETMPPRFAIQINNRRRVTRDYAYFLENRLRERYGLRGRAAGDRLQDFEGALAGVNPERVISPHEVGVRRRCDQVARTRTSAYHCR